MTIHTQKPILLLDAGGTIGMTQSQSGLTNRPGHLESQVTPELTELAADTPVSIEFRSLEPLVDSSQIGVKEWNQLLDLLTPALADYSGIIIAHGTDTLAFTASVLALQLAPAGIPIVLTGAQRPLEVPGSDGWPNLRLALQTCTAQRRGVWVAFGGQVLPGVHVSKVDSVGERAFASPFDTRMTEGEPPAALAGQLPVSLKSHRIAVHHFLPGTPEYDLTLQVRDRPRVLILRTFGAGNAPLSPETILDLKRASDSGTLIINHSQCLRGQVAMDTYAAAAPLRLLGVIGAGTMTLEALTAKLLVILSAAPQAKRTELTQWLLTPWCGELPDAGLSAGQDAAHP